MPYPPRGHIMEDEMETYKILKGKRVLVVDDEPDVLETLTELLDMCQVDTAPDFKTAKKFIDKNAYDAAVLDIMGVDGYELLLLTDSKGIPTLMLTAHALSPDNLMRSLKSGAHAYIPKERMDEIDTYLAEMIQSHKQGRGRSGIWFARLKPFFDKRFGSRWQEKDKDFWREFNKKYVPTKDELEKML